MNESLPLLDSEDRSKRFEQDASKLAEEAETFKKEHSLLKLFLHEVGLAGEAPGLEGETGSGDGRKKMRYSQMGTITTGDSTCNHEVIITNSSLPDHGEKGILTSEYKLAGGKVYQVEFTKPNVEKETEQKTRRFYFEDDFKLVSKTEQAEEEAQKSFEETKAFAEKVKDKATNTVEGEWALWRGWFLALYECESSHCKPPDVTKRKSSDASLTHRYHDGFDRNLPERHSLLRVAYDVLPNRTTSNLRQNARVLHRSRQSACHRGCGRVGKSHPWLQEKADAEIPVPTPMLIWQWRVVSWGYVSTAMEMVSNMLVGC